MEHLKQVKSSNFLISSKNHKNQKLGDIKSVCSSTIESNRQVSLSSPSRWSDVETSLNEYDYDVTPADCVLLYNVVETIHYNFGEKAVKEIPKNSKVSSNVLVRAVRSGATNTNKVSEARPVEVKLTSTNGS